MTGNFVSSSNGVGALTKTGPGTLTLTGSGNTYGGGTTVGGGKLRVMNVPGPGMVTLGTGTALDVGTNVLGNNLLNVAGTGIQISQAGVGPGVFGDWTNSGSVTFSNSGSVVFNGRLTNFSGTISFGNSTGSFRFNNSTNSNNCRGSAFATFDLGTGSATLSNLNGAGLTYDLGSLAGGPNTILAGRLTNNTGTNATLTYSIGANGANTTFSGKIADGFDGSPSAVAVVKVGSGSLLLNGVNTYTGGTTVSNGTLGGTGSIVGPLTVASGAILSPGASIGTFTVNGAATLSGTVLMELNRSNSPAKNDMLVVSGTITAGGALIVANVGPNLVNGSTFTLFNKGVSFGSVTLPATDPTANSPYVWNNNLSTDGTIQLVSGGISSVPINAGVAYSAVGGIGAGTITFTWPSDHQGWDLQSNSVSVANPNSWFTIPGTAALTSTVLNVDPAKTNVFFRMHIAVP
jgi:autotransporter-associated beta strand protein